MRARGLPYSRCRWFDVNGDPVVSGKTVSALSSARSTAGDDASAGLDYTAFSSRVLIVGADNLTGSFEVVVLDDTSDEFNETFTVTLTGGDNATVSATYGSAQVTIADDDDPPRLRIGDVQAGENAGDVTFTVSLFDANDAPVGERQAGDGGLLHCRAVRLAARDAAAGRRCPLGAGAQGPAGRTSRRCRLRR